MTLSEAPAWVEEFIEEKAPWWLEKGADTLDILSVEEHRRIARIKKGRFIYTLLPEYNRIS